MMTAVLDLDTLLSSMVKKVSGFLKDLVGLQETRHMKLKTHHGEVTAKIVKQEEDSYLVEYPYTESWFGKYTAKLEQISADDPRVKSIDPPRRERNAAVS